MTINKKIFLFANSPIIRIGDNYYAESKSFIDFLAELTGLDNSYFLVAPCKTTSSFSNNNVVPIHIPERFIESIYYEGHLRAITTNFINAFRIRAQIIKAINDNCQVIVGGPGPNSFLFWLSFLVPRSVTFIFFIRGDTIKTVHYMYKGKMLYPIIVSLVKAFKYRINQLLTQKRAKVFVFGEKLKEQYPSPKSSVYVCSPLIESSFVRKDQRPTIPSYRPLKVLYVGRLSKEKNVLALVDACTLSLDYGRPFELSIAGYGQLEEEICDHIDKSKASENIKFIGYVRHDMLIEELDKHDILCLPSKTEGTPGVVAEAFARDMPVVATPVGSLPSLFPDEIKFLIGDDAKSILNGITWCDDHRKELSEMGRRGRKTIDKFLITNNAHTINRILQAI